MALWQKTAGGVSALAAEVWSGRIVITILNVHFQKKCEMVLAVAKNHHPVAMAVARVVARRLLGCSGCVDRGFARRVARMFWVVAR